LNPDSHPGAKNFFSKRLEYIELALVISPEINVLFSSFWDFNGHQLNSSEILLTASALHHWTPRFILRFSKEWRKE